MRRRTQSDTVILAFVLYFLAIALAYNSLAQIPLAKVTPATLNRYRLQAALDSGLCDLKPGITQIDAPLYVRARTMLRGCGLASEIRLVGGGDWAVIVAPSSGSLYGAYIDSVSIVGGGVLWTEFAQHCGMDRVWVSGAPGDGVRLAGDGERLRLTDCVSWGNGGAGFRVSCATANNGIIFDHCNAQSNHAEGIVLETVAENAELSETIIRDCTIQSNGGAQVRMTGYVVTTYIRDTWIEAIVPGVVGLLCEPRAPMVRRDPWRVSGLTIDGATTISQIATAARFIDCPSLTIDAMTVYPRATATVEWQTFAPGGRMLRLPASQLRQVAPDEIGTAIKP